MKETEFKLSRLQSRRTYRGGEYTIKAFRPIERTGAEWKALLGDRPAKRITDTDVLVYATVRDTFGREVRRIQYEVYLD